MRTSAAHTLFTSLFISMFPPCSQNCSHPFHIPVQFTPLCDPRSHTCSYTVHTPCSHSCAYLFEPTGTGARAAVPSHYTVRGGGVYPLLMITPSFHLQARVRVLPCPPLASLCRVGLTAVWGGSADGSLHCWCLTKLYYTLDYIILY